MKIGLVIDCFDPERGGAEQVAWQQAQGLVKRGYEVHVVAGRIAAVAEQLPVVPHAIGMRATRVRRAKAAEQVLRSLHLDVVHDYGMGWYGDVLQSEDGSRIAQWEQKLKLLPPWARPVKRVLIRLLPRYSDFRRLMARQFGDPRRVVMAVSKMCAADYQRYNHVPAEQIRLVYHGVDNERFSHHHRARYRNAIREQWSVRADEVLFLFVGHDFQRKGLATAIRAIGRLAVEGHSARLLVVGGGSRRSLVRLARRCDPVGAVTFTGTVAEVAPYYAAADVHVLPTFYDPCSLSVLEAAASGLPNITTQFNGAGEVLTDGVDGYVVPDAADDRQLATRMRMLIDPGLRRRMGDAARRLALEYSLDRNCEQVIAIYHELAGRKRCAA